MFEIGVLHALFFHDYTFRVLAAIHPYARETHANPKQSTPYN